MNTKSTQTSVSEQEMEIPEPPHNPGKKPPAYASDPHNPNDPDFEKTQPYAKQK
jgi:hypothetical protein